MELLLARSVGAAWICKPGDPSSNPRRDIIFVSVTVIYNVRTTHAALSQTQIFDNNDYLRDYKLFT